MTTYTVSTPDGPPLATGLTLAEAGRLMARDPLGPSPLAEAPAMTDAEAEVFATTHAGGLRDDDGAALWTDDGWRQFLGAVVAHNAEARSVPVLVAPDGSPPYPSTLGAMIADDDKLGAAEDAIRDYLAEGRDYRVEGEAVAYSLRIDSAFLGAAEEWIAAARAKRAEAAERMRALRRAYRDDSGMSAALYRDCRRAQLREADRIGRTYPSPHAMRLGALADRAERFASERPDGIDAWDCGAQDGHAAAQSEALADARLYRVAAAILGDDGASAAPVVTIRPEG